MDGELEPGLRSHYPTMVESNHKIYVVYSKFYHELDPHNRTDLGIQLVEVRSDTTLLTTLPPQRSQPSLRRREAYNRYPSHAQK